MLSRSGTFMDTMSSGSNRAGIPSCVSATSKACAGDKDRRGGGGSIGIKQRCSSQTVTYSDVITQRGCAPD
ncbi:hypothetical protein EYF80_031803 [Liparis tanakae]|uniref:Uncharacterized protein n=1 Tax=Liparis tanakae TaxID=230148 RepID=A0A4Z2GX09_9TELE|nr:hypothetical protein EYF80_031803 [Liparis tanakae]